MFSEHGTRVYRSESGEYNYYPTSAHKRREPQKTTVEQEGLASAARETRRATNSSSRDTAHLAAVSPSSAGLSRSPSQTASVKQSVTFWRSVSQPISQSPPKTNEASKPAPATVSVAGAAPLLHRYRTSQAVCQHQLSRANTASSPLSTVDGNSVKKVSYHRRSLLPKAAAPQGQAGSSDAVAASTALFAASPQQSSGGAESARSRSASPQVTRVKTDKAPIENDAVPVARVQLADPPQCTASGGNVPAGRSKLSKTLPQQRLARVSCSASTPQQPDEAAFAQGEKDGGATAQEDLPSLSYSHLADAVLSRDASQMASCSDDRCLHSERSICEFIFMQRELRRCYAAMEDYEAVVAELRQECADAWSAFHHQQQKFIQREEEVEAAVRAELAEQLNPPPQEEEKAPAGAASAENEARPTRISSKVLGDEMKACLVTTWREALHEVQQALHEEKTAHAECRRQLDEARCAERRWTLNVTKLQAGQSHACQQVEGSSPGPADAELGQPLHGALMCSPPASLSRRLSSDARGTSPGFSHTSSLSSPAPRRFSPPQPHRAQGAPRTQRAPVVGEMETDASWLSALTKESSLIAGETSCVMAGETRTASESVLSTSAVSTLSEDAVERDAVEAVGSGVVLVEPPRTVSAQRRPQAAVGAQSTERMLASPPSEQETPVAAEAARRDSVGEMPEVNQNAPSTAALPSLGGSSRSKSSPSLVLSDSLQQKTLEFQRCLVDAPGSPLQLYPFPPPVFSEEAEATPSRTRCPLSHPPQRQGKPAAPTGGELTERRCKELLCALLDKERQLAEVAEERTKYKLLCKQDSNVTL